MFIDIHTHAYHPKIADKVLAQLEGHYGIPPVGTGQIDDLLERATKAGLDKVVVHNAATAPAQVVPANNWAIAIHREHKRIISFGTLHPDYPDFERELDRLWRNGIKGIKFHADFQGFRLDDRKLWPIFEALSGRFVVMLHVGDRLPPEENNSCPAKVAAILRDFPQLTVIAAHMGGYLHWQYAVEHLVGKNVYIDTSSTLAFIDDATLRRIFDGHPRERILFGSDYPLFDPGEEIARLRRRLSLRDAELEEILGGASALFRSSK
ncbi:amidohydrolase family protein [Solidesulfovibrio magneticus]|uniref:Amidohydrolase 2 family protein n=1 Tax=Solidesulfovibrio magneticus (strain ATCC 700980 / DSM 13731 / RS-1) TaxID=573370 RepID=C4XHL3_SOLM1|nr:amidohydrolase family protein [Solidesulfovibrio magneticus]BAH76387.1 amidohydrolase 2 family protein [Solidesulfovibrio magneticus RS-1]